MGKDAAAFCIPRQRKRRCDPQKARGKLARPRLIAFDAFEGKDKASGSLRARGMTEEKGAQKAGKANAHCLWRV